MVLPHGVRGGASSSQSYDQPPLRISAQWRRCRDSQVLMTGVQQRVIFEFPVNLPRAGSINNFAGLKRCPSAGCQGPERDNHNANPGAHPADNRAKFATVPWQVIAMFLAIGVKDTSSTRSA